MTNESAHPTESRKNREGKAPSQSAEHLTTSQGSPLSDTDHSLKVGERGPILLQDHHLREKIMHFDHERIPERVVHARGAGAHGTFTSYGNAGDFCAADFLKPGKQTEVFVRFSTVAGSRGSMDTARDTRGFATKFYTDEGVFDLVGNNIPVFFIQDGMKFPDVVHAVKPEPDREIPQAQSAHNTFWDFVSLHTPAQAHTLWNMSDRGIPRSYRMMEGFGVHTFRLIGPEGKPSLVKFHWKPKLGVHSLTWEEAQLAGGADPDFHRRDLADAIEAGAFPEWELGVQLFEDDGTATFQGIDLLDPTKFVPEGLAPVQLIGKMVLDRNPSNYFAETEQVAFHPGHLVPGIDITDDPLLQARLFSYLDTQLTRLGGPNFSQIPVNQPKNPVNDMFRDGFHQHNIHEGVAPYQPNSLDGGCPFMADLAEGQSFPALEYPQETSGAKKRSEPVSFSDHYSQARLFYRSLSAQEREHIKQAYSFELGKCTDAAIRERQVQCLAEIDGDLAASVATALGLEAPAAQLDVEDLPTSSALSQIGSSWPVDGRQIGIVVGLRGYPQDRALAEAISAKGMTPLIVAPHAGATDSGLEIDRTYFTTRSIEFDALVLAGALPPVGDARVPLDTKAGADVSDSPAADPRVVLLVQEAYRQSKPILCLDEASFGALSAAGIAGEAPGVELVDAQALAGTLAELVAAHRVWGRFPAEG
ncbi:catalase [Glutamicibacter protophormiae]|uniref:Catalase n=1 Tax=Glutamicibacter protophormiae TaxID=37930 RepID=A0ABS4XQ02_GLUPR|nr:catalase [Glutamicibacter protophormiae]MBP2398542.1 catalase [Glutamicibacter protophormiae]GGL94581.1 catalase [Glutamicibacter protophormiae]